MVYMRKVTKLLPNKGKAKGNIGVKDGMLPYRNHIATEIRSGNGIFVPE